MPVIPDTFVLGVDDLPEVEFAPPSVPPGKHVVDLFVLQSLPNRTPLGEKGISTSGLYDGWCSRDLDSDGVYRFTINIPALRTYLQNISSDCGWLFIDIESNEGEFEYPSDLATKAFRIINYVINQERPELLVGGMYQGGDLPYGTTIDDDLSELQRLFSSKSVITGEIYYSSGMTTSTIDEYFNIINTVLKPQLRLGQKIAIWFGAVDESGNAIPSDINNYIGKRAAELDIIPAIWGYVSDFTSGDDIPARIAALTNYFNTNVKAPANYLSTTYALTEPLSLPVLKLIPRVSVPILSVTFYSDIALDEPEIIGTKDRYTGTIYQNNAQICTIYGATIDLMWNPVDQADYYVVHVCKNSSFNGPTLNTYTLKDSDWTGPSNYRAVSPTAGNEINFSVEYYWRVMAYNKTGGASPKSTVYQFTFSCEEQTGDGSNNSSSSSSSSSSSRSSSSSSSSSPVSFGASIYRMKVTNLSSTFITCRLLTGTTVGTTDINVVPVINHAVNDIIYAAQSNNGTGVSGVSYVEVLTIGPTTKYKVLQVTTTSGNLDFDYVRAH